MISRTSTLAERTYRMVRLVCDYCPRCGQYRKDTPIARFGGDVLMPDARHLIAECPRTRQARLAECTTRTCANAAIDGSC